MLIFLSFSLCILQLVFVSSLPDKSPENENNFAFPPQNSFCLFTTGEFVFEDKMKEKAPSAKLEGAVTVEKIYVDAVDACEKKILWGALYFIKNEDQEKLVEFIYEERLTIADVTVTRSDRGESLDCMSMDVGILPHAYPLSIYKEFPRDICVKDYLDRLTKIGVPQEYVTWLGTLQATKKDDPVPPYVVSPCFYAPPTEGCPPPFNNGIGPQITEYDLPEDKLCVFVDGDLIIEETMKSLIPSATLIGAAMLGDKYVGLGCPTRPDKFVKYKGFDNVWGAAYTITKKDLDIFIKAGNEYLFKADVRTILNELTEAECKTFHIGPLPSGFPFNVFKTGKLDIDAYTEGLKKVGVPSGYVDAVMELSIKIHTYEEMAKNPQVGILPVERATDVQKNPQ